jgi:ABC-type polysaccharide/polyol phosphate export permease
VVLLAWMYLTPIIYPESIVPVVSSNNGIEGILQRFPANGYVD